MSRWPGNAQRERTTFGGLLRGQLMSRVRSTGNQTTEKRLASLLRAAGLTGWRTHQSLPGRPDFVWLKLIIRWRGLHGLVRLKLNVRRWGLDIFVRLLLNV